MLPLVETSVQNLKNYEGLASDEVLQEIENLSKDLKGLRVLMINSTPRGGGVAEILKSLIPLLKGLGVDAQWYTIPCYSDFFKVTKKIHNLLQGKKERWSILSKRKYLKYQKEIACRVKDMKADLWVVHDPQPAGIISYLNNFHPSVCRLHIDLTSPNKNAWNFIVKFLKQYDKVVVTSPEYVKEEIKEKSVVFPPGIDPLVLKNQPIERQKAQTIVESFGILSNQPLVTQVARFDIFKDPLGAVAAYQVAKKKIPKLQLALVGFFLAQDDPSALKIYKKVKKECSKDPDIFLFSNADQLGGLRVDAFVRAIQVASDVILHKAIREGFGLAVAEALWKEKAVVGGDAGGIKLQIKNGENGFLVSSPREAGEKIVELIKNPDLAERLGKAGKKIVQEKFLITRVLRDYLKLFKELV